VVKLRSLELLGKKSSLEPSESEKSEREGKAASSRPVLGELERQVGVPRNGRRHGISASRYLRGPTTSLPSVLEVPRERGLHSPRELEK